MFTGDHGMNNRPAYITIFWGKNPVDLFVHSGESWEILGEEVQNIFNDLSSTTRKLEKNSFWYMKELSCSTE